jgi:hypothetical protein
MYWPKFSKEALQRKIQKNKTPSGVSCTFIPWTKYTGLKMFSSKRQRDHSYKGQSAAASYKLAPKVGDKVSVTLLTACGYGAPNPEFQEFYGFFTETAKVAPRGASRHESRLVADLSEIGIEHHDLHVDNIGKIGKRFVAIDFDSCSCLFTRKLKKK